MADRKVILTIAPAGGMADKSVTPRLPTQPEEIADDVYRCCQAGASAWRCMHARPDDGATCDPQVYRQINDLIRQRCDIVINNSTGGGISGDMVAELGNGRKEIAFEQRIKGTMAGAEMCTFDPHMQCMHRDNLELLLDTSWSRCIELAEAMKQRGIKPEWEVMSLSDLYWVKDLIALGYDEPPHYVNIVLGTNKLMSGATPYSPKNLQRFAEDSACGRSLASASAPSARLSCPHRCTASSSAGRSGSAWKTTCTTHAGASLPTSNWSSGWSGSCTSSDPGQRAGRGARHARPPPARRRRSAWCAVHAPRGRPATRASPRFCVGTDVGGTFTDLWAIGEDGRQIVVKAPSTPDIITGILDAIGLAAGQAGLPPAEFCAFIDHFGHGTTAGLNALLTGRTAATAVITTEGFRDTLEIGQLKRQAAGLSGAEASDYANRGQRAPVVPRQLVFEVAERVDSQGTVVTPLDEAQVRRVLDLIAASGVRAVAVCTLWSVACPAHELRIGELIAERLPAVFVSLSHEVHPASASTRECPPRPPTPPSGR